MASLSGSPGFVWGIILAIAVGTFAARLSFVVLFGRVETVPDWVERLLGLVAPAALAALTLPSFLLVDGGLALSPGNERLLAGSLAALVAYRTGNLLATVVVGMAAFWALQLVA